MVYGGILESTEITFSAINSSSWKWEGAKFWEDVWLFQTSPKIQYPSIYSIAQTQDATVSEMWSEQDRIFGLGCSKNDCEFDRVPTFV